MKTIYLLLLSLIIFISCKSEEPQNPPTVVTKVATNISTNNATLIGEVVDEGYSATSERGFVYSDKNPNPSVSDSKIQSGYGKGEYSVVLDKLPANSKYYYKAYATNTKGTSYGVVQSFTSADYKLPNIITDLPKNITQTTVELLGAVTDEGGGTVSESGFVVGLKNLPTISDLKFPVTKGKSIINLIITKLNVNTKYYARAYAQNEKGVSYGNEQVFTTLDYKLPTVSTDIPNNIGYNSVEFSGSIKDNGGGNIKESGFVYSNSPITYENVIGNSIIVVGPNNSTNINIWIDNIRTNTKYYVRSYAFNEKGFALGEEQVFTTLTVTTVTSKTGRIWMDRNLGAKQLATSMSAYLSYGDSYQWGRGIDGHQIGTSKSTFTRSNKDQPGNNLFITVVTNNSTNLETGDWRSPQNDELWQGKFGVNNPCPPGFRIPTEKEWDDERKSWTANNTLGAISSPLKLPASGIRNTDGSFNYIGSRGYYWSSTITNSTTSSRKFSSFLLFESQNALNISGSRSLGLCVRCIMD